MRELIEFIAKSLVENPDKVEVTELEQGSTSQINLIVDADDMGRVIGRRGNVANAMRNLLRVAAVRKDVRAHLTIVEPE
jgi:uncharacterized protein